MTDTAGASVPGTPQVTGEVPGGKGPARRTPRSVLANLEIDASLLGMIGAFAIICIVFQVMTGGLLDGRFLTPRNVFNLTIQTVSVAIMATGMVFVIVTRNIDLSVGALLATCSAVMAMVQTAWVPDLLGLPLNHWAIAPLAVVAGLVTGAVIGGFQGWLIGYLLIPSFIVTLGGLLVWRNVAWYLTSGQTIGPLDATFRTLGGIGGTLGAQWSWIVGLVAALLALWALIASRRAKMAHDFPVKPVWAEVVVGAIAAGADPGVRRPAERLRGAVARRRPRVRGAGDRGARGLRRGLRHPRSASCC